MQKMEPELQSIAPMECLNVQHLLEGENWQYEVKFDGYRAIPVKNSCSNPGHTVDWEAQKTQFVKRLKELMDKLAAEEAQNPCSHVTSATEKHSSSGNRPT
jgi:hypothetical protein